MPTVRKYAMVTPYYKEDRRLIERCIASVRAQSIQTEHFLIADGFPQPWIDSEPVRHIKLDRSHGDYGNTPRGVGGMLAISEGYEGIGFLDADNWLEPDHVSSCRNAGQTVSGCDFVIARWHLRRPDESIIDIETEPVSEHVDTSCFFLLPGSFHVIPYFALMPRQLSPIGDRIFFAAIKRADLKSAIVQHKTVNYHCLWSSFYAAIGEVPPAGAKPNIDSSEIDKWLLEQDQRQLEVISRRSGVQISLAGSVQSRVPDQKI